MNYLRLWCNFGCISFSGEELKAKAPPVELCMIGEVIFFKTINLGDVRQRDLMLNPNTIKSGYKESHSIELRGLNKKGYYEGKVNNPRSEWPIGLYIIVF